MAIRIQQQFWYARARWATKQRLVKRMAGFEYRTANRLDLNAFIPVLQATQPTLQIWLNRVLMVNESTMQDVSGTVARVMAAYVFAMYGTQIVPLTMEHTAALILASERLSIFMTSMMNGDLYCKKTVSKLVQILRNYLAVYSIWQSANEASVHRLLVQQSLLLVHDVLAQRITAIDNKAAAMLLLIKKYTIVLCGSIETVKNLVLGCKEMKLIRSLPSSEMWGPGNLSVFRLMHELLIDEQFKITVESTLPKFTAKYAQIPTSPLAVTGFLADLRAVIMWPVHEEEFLMDMAQIMDIENMQWPEDVSDIANRLVPVICKAIPNANIASGIRDQWQAIGSEKEAILAFLMESALKLRYVYGTMDQEQCRRNIRRHDGGFYPSAANMLISKATHTKRTEMWLQHTLETYAQKTLERVALGDSFAILGLHDQAIVAFALQGDFVSPPPETLVFDIPRLKIIHANVGLIGEGDAANEHLRTTLQKIVDDEDISSKYPKHLADAAMELRNIIFVSRFQHGEMVSALARDVATRLLEANAMLAALK